MAECAELRPLVLAHFDGECPPGDFPRVEAHLLSCEDCGSRWDRASVGVGLFLMADAGEAGGTVAGPGPEFTARVMERIAREPRSAPPPAQRLRIEPPPPPPPARRWGLWAGVGGAAVAAAAAFVLILRHDATMDSGTGGATILASGGGVLRWTADAGSQSLAGSTWIAKGDSTAIRTLHGELLHSPAPSSCRVRLPEGGRLDTGPSSWLAVGGAGEAALLEGGFTASADGTKVVELHTPAGVVSTGGEAEISLRSPGGEARAKGLAWLGALAASWRGGAAAVPLPAPPGAVMVVFARRGPAKVVLGGGPVRNSLERVTAVQLREGQALVVLETKTFVVEDARDDAPADSARWTDGMPVPPGSVVFRDAPVSDGPTPGPVLAVSGPVRNSLERVLTDPGSDPAARAYALKVYEGVGGVEAVEAAARAASDPAVMVRAAAVRVLALNAWADRPRALEALRKLALDPDPGVARFAILALKTLGDREAIPALRSLLVDDGKPVAYPAIVAKVYGFDALVALGDPSLVANAASLTPAAEYDPELSRALQQAILDAFDALPRDEPRKYIEDPRPPVRAAAIETLRDLDVARAALSSPEERVRIAGARVLLRTMDPRVLDDLAKVAWDTPAARRAVLMSAYPLFFGNEALTVPPWLVQVAKAAFENRAAPDSEAPECIYFLARSGVSADFNEILASGTARQRLAVLDWIPVSIGAGIPLLKDADLAIREAALVALRKALLAKPGDAEAATLLERMTAFVPSSYREAQLKGTVFSSLLRDGDVERCLAGLLGMAASDSVLDRRAASTFLSTISDREATAKAVLSLLENPDRETAERAAETIVVSALRRKWAGPPFESLFPSHSPFPTVRALVAIAALKAGVPGADAAIRGELAHASSRTRLRVLTVLSNMVQKVPSLGHEVLVDPTPEVRLLAIRHQEDPASHESARVLSNDISLWVRAVALGTLASAGEEDSATRLRELYPALRNSTAVAARMFGPIAPDNPSFGEIVGMVATNVLQSGGVGQGLLTPDSALATLLQMVLNRSRAVGASDVLLSSPEPAKRASIARKLEDLPGRVSIDSLLHATDEARESDGHVREVAAGSLARLFGFEPSESWSKFSKEHFGGYVTPAEIRAQGSQ